MRNVQLGSTRACDMFVVPPTPKQKERTNMCRWSFAFGQSQPRKARADQKRPPDPVSNQTLGFQRAEGHVLDPRETQGKPQKPREVQGKPKGSPKQNSRETEAFFGFSGASGLSLPRAGRRFLAPGVVGRVAAPWMACGGRASGERGAGFAGAASVALLVRWAGNEKWHAPKRNGFPDLVFFKGISKRFIPSTWGRCLLSTSEVGNHPRLKHSSESTFQLVIKRTTL